MLKITVTQKSIAEQEPPRLSQGRPPEYQQDVLIWFSDEEYPSKFRFVLPEGITHWPAGDYIFNPLTQLEKGQYNGLAFRAFARYTLIPCTPELLALMKTMDQHLISVLRQEMGGAIGIDYSVNFQKSISTESVVSVDSANDSDVKPVVFDRTKTPQTASK